MKFVHSFWSKPLFNNKFSAYQELLPVVLSNYAYSAACIKAQGHLIRLFTDKIGAELLNFVPYDEIKIVTGLDNQSIHFAVQIKFEALKQMSPDEILIDGDLFMRHPAAFERLTSLKQDFIYSFYEPNSFILSSDVQTERYKELLKILDNYKQNFHAPYELDPSIKQFSWPNTSLMKFNNEDLKSRYIKQYNYHRTLLEKEEFGAIWPDILIEQRHMDKLLKYGFYSSAPIIEDFPSSEANDYAVKIGFTHLGAGKLYYKDLTFKWLQELEPVLYQRTLEQIDKFQNKC